MATLPMWIWYRPCVYPYSPYTFGKFVKWPIQRFQWSSNIVIYKRPSSFSHEIMIFLTGIVGRRCPKMVHKFAKWGWLKTAWPPNTWWEREKRSQIYNLLGNPTLRDISHIFISLSLCQYLNFHKPSYVFFAPFLCVRKKSSYSLH